jgi:hypothetical protein
VKLIKSLRNVALAAMLFSAGVANAALYQFQLTGDYTASWQMNSTADPDFAFDGFLFSVYDVEGNFPGSLANLADLTFYNADAGGGFEIIDFLGDQVLLVTDGRQLYTGPERSPTFLLGTFALSEFEGFGNYMLTVTDLDALPGPGEVPEPATAALLLGGLGVLLASRKRRQAK